MLTLYRSGNGRLHRMPTGPKTILLCAAVLGISVLPTAWWAAAVSIGLAVFAYAVAELGNGMRELARQIIALRWMIAITLLGQTMFLGPELAAINVSRIVAAIAIAGLLAMTTPVSGLLDTFERGLRPLRALRVDPQRAALLLTVALSTIPVLARLAGDVRDAHRARGARTNPRLFVTPFLVVALKHADELGDSLAARGVR